jgi:hypothetical protein
MCLTGKTSLRKFLAGLSPQEKAQVRNELQMAIGCVVRAENIVLKGHKNRHSLIVTDKPVSLYSILRELKEQFEPERQK